MLRVNHLSGFNAGTAVAESLTGAQALLSGEEGLAIDATTSGGTVTVKDYTTPANIVTNVSLATFTSLANTNASTKVIKHEDGTLHTVSANTIAQEWDGTRWGILCEAAATNLCLQSQDIATTWTNTNSTESTNATTAPDGTSTADKIVEASDTAQAHSITQSISITSGDTYMFSVYAKKSERTWLALAGSTTRLTVSASAYFDLDNGVVGTVVGSGVTSAIENIGSGWYRCSMGTLVCDSTGANNFQVFLAEADNDVTYNGDGSSGLFVWGAQLEQTSTQFSTGPARPTSYIATTTVSVTRAADNIALTLTTIPFSATAGTFVSWIGAQTTNFTNNSALFVVHDGTTNETWQGQTVAASTPDAIGAVLNDGGVNQMGAAVTGSLSASGNKVAHFMKLNDSGYLVDAGSEAVDTGCTLPTVTTLNLGYSAVTASRLFTGYIYQIRYFPRRMTTAEMQARTT